MGVTSWPCPKCGQQQRKEHANGELVKSEKCPSCKEESKPSKADGGS